MMHLLKPGMVVFNGDYDDGLILFTQTTFFALRPGNDATRAGTLLGGLLGAWIGRKIDARRAAKSSLPDHLGHPEIVALGPDARKELLPAKLLCSIPLSAGFKARQTWTGFDFTAEGYPKVGYKNLPQKKAIRTYVLERGIPLAT